MLLAILDRKFDEIRKRMATKADIGHLKVWVLAGTLSGIGGGAAIATVAALKVLAN